MVYTYRSDTGRVRSNNEDFIAVPEKGIVMGLETFDTENLGTLFILCDGMGGANAGEIASSMAGAILLKEYYSLDRIPEDPGFFVTEKLVETNGRILRRGLNVPDYYGMGTTIVSLLAVKRDAYINSVGDSRAYLFRDGSLEQITEDQSLVWDYYKSGRMTKEEIRVHPKNNILTCALGIDPHMLISSVESYKLDIMQGDLYLLCSDGLSDLIGDRELESILEEGLSVDGTADTLVDTANSRGGKDNISLILVQY